MADKLPGLATTDTPKPQDAPKPEDAPKVQDKPKDDAPEVQAEEPQDDERGGEDARNAAREAYLRAWPLDADEKR